MTLDHAINEERSKVDELRRRMKGFIPQEMYEDESLFQRFLRARGNNIDAAEIMLNNHIIWRQENNVDSILTDYKVPEVVQKYTALNRIAFDKDGDPVIYIHFGNVDTRGIIKSTKRAELINYLTYSFEDTVAVMKEHSEKLGKPINQWTWIFNYENFSLSVATHMPTIQILIHLISMYEANYPERLKAAYLVNASWVFSACWKFLKPFLSGPTAQKVYIFGKDKWQEEFRSFIDADELPKFLGGNRTDPDGNPRCTKSILFGGKVPEHYYLRRNSRAFSLKPDARTQTVNRLSKLDVELGVLQPGAIIGWELDLKSRDIGFSVILKEDPNIKKDSNHREVLSKQRVEAGVTESGCLKCEKAGLYVLEFDNSHCWLYNKEITFSTSVSPS